MSDHVSYPKALDPRTLRSRLPERRHKTNGGPQDRRFSFYLDRKSRGRRLLRRTDGLPQISRVADDDLTAHQRLEADGEPTASAVWNGRGPMPHPRAAELLNGYLEGKVGRMARR